MSRYTSGEEILVDMGGDLRSRFGYYVDEHENEIYYRDDNGKHHAVASWKVVPVKELQTHESSEVYENKD